MFAFRRCQRTEASIQETEARGWKGERRNQRPLVLACLQFYLYSHENVVTSGLWSLERFRGCSLTVCRPDPQTRQGSSCSELRAWRAVASAKAGSCSLAFLWKCGKPHGLTTFEQEAAEGTEPTF